VHAPGQYINCKNAFVFEQQHTAKSIYFDDHKNVVTIKNYFVNIY